ncbi:hypothetical protein BpHYR1_034592 [Brachionus plicatilis]|uniref:Uncharacterized protein n=1 Tax=Brachionus plicatilis TaxID=10195 RepID=A0A3M7QKS8_BRAPC|nr:hypothetical protein BpHYR1_034592 [Brachionus plicatilis]
MYLTLFCTAAFIMAIVKSESFFIPRARSIGTVDFSWDLNTARMRTLFEYFVYSSCKQAEPNIRT